MTHPKRWNALAMFLFLAAWAVALLGDPQGEMGRVTLSAALCIGAILSIAKGGLLK